MTPPRRQTYAQRAANHVNPAAKLLLLTIERKHSNLAVSVDVTKSKNFLAIVDAVGPYVCLIKTHIDIIEDFDGSLISSLIELSHKHDFVIFEDRKFADIGNTVALQYSSGVYKIAEWAHITNAHPVPGPFLAEMSTKGSLATDSYTEAAVHMARQHRDFVIGFIAQRRMDGGDMNEDFLVLTPGVSLDEKGDTMGQRYRTPREVICDSGCDIIIVGRGIYGKDLKPTEVIRAQAKRYQKEGWAAYTEDFTNA